MAHRQREQVLEPNPEIRLRCNEEGSDPLLDQGSNGTPSTDL